MAFTDAGEKIIDIMLDDKCSEIILQKVEDNIPTHKVENKREPVFWEEYIAALSSEDIRFEESYAKYVMPALCCQNINNFIKKILRLNK